MEGKPVQFYKSNNDNSTNICCSRSNLSKVGEELVGLLLTTLNQLSLEAQEVNGRDICHLLHQTVT